MSFSSKKWSVICLVVMGLGFFIKPLLTPSVPTTRIKQVSSPTSTLLPTITVHIAGNAVKYPGVYEIPPNWTTLDLINHIPLLPNANLDKLKLASHIKPNSRIVIPVVKTRHSIKKKSMTSHQTVQVSINISNESELIAIPGIGPSMAKRIISYRRKQGRFNSLKELTKVRGIGNKTFQKMKPYIML